VSTSSSPAAGRASADGSRPDGASAGKLLLLGGTGYIGSRLYRYLASRGMAVDTVDLELRGNRVNPDNIKMDYQYLTAQFLSGYGTVVLLAAHANVAQSLQDPYGAFENNLVKFANLISKLSGQRLIYASSSSVYSGVGGQVVDESWSTFNFVNMYDFTKYACDAVSQMLYGNFYALRFGTVCGASENLRLDLMINRMVWSGLTQRRVNVSNPQVRRPILGIEDLCRAVELIVRGADRPGIYNLCSFNTTVAEVGRVVADILGCDVQQGAASPTYDFSMENGKIALEYGFRAEESVPTIVEGLVRLHRTVGLDGFR
jgi:nucleoside-diphosphate-sugar epimerase